MKACLIQSNPVMGDIQTNFNWIKKQIISNDADIYVAPELALIGYPPDDLLFDKEFIKLYYEKNYFTIFLFYLHFC